MNDVMTDSDQLRRSITRARQRLADVQEATSGLKECIDELNGTWTGGNHDEFVADFERTYELMTGLDASVERYLEGLDQAATEYDRADADLMGISRKVRA